MKASAIAFGIVAALLMVAPSANAVIYNFSTDLGSDLDFSDPITPSNNFMDCGDVYLENQPTLIKDDSLAPGTATGDAAGDGLNLGHPFPLAPQPVPALIGSANANVGLVPEEYMQYFDLDAEDQIELSLEDPMRHEQVIVAPKNTPGIYYEPKIIDLSFEDDQAPGWYLAGDIPTTSPPDNAVEIVRDFGPFWGGAPGLSWTPPTLAVARTEMQLGLGPDPQETACDDDVDALDTEIHRFWYWSADHEANMGLDPGSIYMTDQFPGAPNANQIQVIDDSVPALATGLWLGIPEDTDVDAFEFVGIGEETYMQIFGQPVSGLAPEDQILCCLFSVDADDPDTIIFSDLYGDESGGLLDSGVYISDMLGNYALMADYGQGVDAITTAPEPSTIVLMCLMAIGGMVLHLRRRK